MAQPPKPRCQGQTKKGLPCPMPVWRKSDTHCMPHDPTITREQRMEWSAKGGDKEAMTRVPLVSYGHVLRWLERQACSLLKGELEREQVQAAVQIGKAAMDCLDRIKAEAAKQRDKVSKEEYTKGLRVG